MELSQIFSQAQREIAERAARARSQNTSPNSPTQPQYDDYLELRDQCIRESQRADLGKFYIALHNHIQDTKIREFLRDYYINAGDPGAAGEAIYKYAADERKRSMDSPSAGGWSVFATNMGVMAERLWRDALLPLAELPSEEEQRLLAGVEYKTIIWPTTPNASWRSPDKSDDQSDLRNAISPLSLQLQTACELALSLLRYQLEGKLYKYRADLNSKMFTPYVGVSVEEEQRKVRQEILGDIRDYQKTIRVWNTELRKVTGRSLFKKPFADMQFFRQLAKAMLSSEDEPGWAGVSEFAYEAIRYQVFEERRKDSFTLRSGPLGWLRALFLWSIRETTGYGKNLWRFARTAIGAIALFTALFWLNDYFNRGITSSEHYCEEAHMASMSFGSALIHYFYLAVTNLFSLGSSSALAEYCGGTSTEALLIASALTGYFLFATLAALIFELIANSL